jgi:hypothetical protein
MARTFQPNLKARTAVGILLLSGAIFLAAILVRGGKIPPDRVMISTPHYTPEIENLDLNFGKYGYHASWNGIPAGAVTLTLDRRGDDYVVSARARTAKFIDIFYKLRFRAEAQLSADTLHPKRSLFKTRENSRQKRTEIEFLPNGEIASQRKGSSGEIKSYRFNPENDTLDPFSAAFLALSLEWEVGQTRKFDTFNGKSRYLIELTAVEKTDIEVNDELREAMVISPSVTDLSDGESSEKLHEAKIYVATDSSREILLIVSDLFIGSIKAEMVSYSASLASD